MAGAVEKILVIKLGALGDFIQALGPMRAIRQHHPRARIVLMTTAPYKEFASACGYFDEIWIDDKPGWTDFSGWFRLAKKLNADAFSRVYDLQNSDRTALYFRLFRSRARPEWVGTAKGASHRNASPDRSKGHAFEGHVQTLGLAGIRNIEIDRLEWMNADISGFPARNPYVLLVPGSAPDRREKRWPARNYAALANALAEKKIHPVIIGGSSEKDAASEIAQAAPEALDLSGRTDLFQVARLARGAAGAIGNDTGPIHLIAATGCPVVALFSGRSDAVKHAPRGENVSILKSENLNDLDPASVLKAFRPE